MFSFQAKLVGTTWLTAVKRLVLYWSVLHAYSTDLAPCSSSLFLSLSSGTESRRRSTEEPQGLRHLPPVRSKPLGASLLLYTWRHAALLKHGGFVLILIISLPGFHFRWHAWCVWRLQVKKTVKIKAYVADVQNKSM